MAKRKNTNRVWDIVSVGAGPAALALLHAAQRAGLVAVALDKGPVCSALLEHPTYMRWFSTSENLELGGFPLVTMDKNPTRREYLKYCQAFVKFFALDVVTYEEVVKVRKRGDLFEIESCDMFGWPTRWQARNVVVCTGFYDTPRPLNVPGEELAKVSHRYREAHYYGDQDVVVVGGGSSAAEVALDIWRYGGRVTVVMRGERFDTKYWIEPDIENRIREGAIRCFRRAQLVRIGQDDVVVRDAEGIEIVVPNDFVLVMTGYEPDTSLLELAGAQVDKVTGKPALTEHFETTMPGLYVAGALCAGCESNTVFIENSREHGPAIVDHIRSVRGAGTDQH